MELRQATEQDLPQLREVYERIIEDMNRKGIQIWDEVYPCEFFPMDIQNKCLYILEEGNTILSAFALCSAHAGAQQVEWEKRDSKALYLDRFAVNVDFLKQGMGSRTLRKAVALAREKGAAYLRLFVVDVNEPAIRLYVKNGFQQAKEIYREQVEEHLVLQEYGFEIKTELE